MIIVILLMGQSGQASQVIDAEGLERRIPDPGSVGTFMEHDSSEESRVPHQLQTQYWL